MKGSSIDDAVIQYYTEQMLSPDVISLLRAKTESVKTAQRSIPAAFKEKYRHFKAGYRHFKAGYRQYAVAVCFALVVFAIIPLYFMLGNSEDSLAMKVAQEISINHNKQLTSEYLPDNYADISVSMDRLNFTIKSPERLEGQEFQLLGARYCTIQGQIAAQLKLSDSDGELTTLYVTQSTAELKSLHNNDQSYKNLVIKSWHEGDLFFGLAQSKSE